MGIFSSLFSKKNLTNVAKDVVSEVVDGVVNDKKSTTTSKKTKTSKASKNSVATSVKKTIKNTTKDSSLKKTLNSGLTEIIKSAIKNDDVVSCLTDIAGLFGNEPSSKKVTTAVKKLFNTLKKQIGKLDETEFKSITTKLLSDENVKKVVNGVVGKSGTTFIKKAITAYFN